jgi:hypothetical protein
LRSGGAGEPEEDAPTRDREAGTAVSIASAIPAFATTKPRVLSVLARHLLPLARYRCKVREVSSRGSCAAASGVLAPEINSSQIVATNGGTCVPTPAPLIEYGNAIRTTRYRSRHTIG